MKRIRTFLTIKMFELFSMENVVDYWAKFVAYSDFFFIFFIYLFILLYMEENGT